MPIKKILGAALLSVSSLAAWGAAEAQMSLDPRDLEAKYLGPSDVFLEIGGLNYRVRVEGAFGAPPVFLLHGFTSSLETWDDVAAGLSETHRVIRYDLSGHGLTGPDAEQRYTADERAAALLGLMDALEIETATIIGNSLGGFVAWKFAAQNPSRTDDLVLISAAAFPFAGLSEEAQPIAPALEAYLLHGSVQDVAYVYGTQFFEGQKADPDRIQVYFDMMRRAGNPQAFVDHTNLFVLPDPAAELSQIRARTLVLWGEQDPLIPVDHAGRLAALISGATLRTIPSMGHIPQEEDPGRTLDAIRAFLGSGRSNVAAADE